MNWNPQIEWNLELPSVTEVLYSVLLSELGKLQDGLSTWKFQEGNCKIDQFWYKNFNDPGVAFQF